MTMSQRGWIERLRSRWKLKSAGQVVLVLLVFACTGFTVVYLKGPVLRLVAGDPPFSTIATIVYYVLILPIYNIILLAYGFLFGQFRFFWEFEKRFVRRLISIFR
jgi:hypothetical protein